MQKRYEYKVYSTTGTYLGTWGDVVSDFTMLDEIDAPGSGTSVTLGRMADDLGNTVAHRLNVKVWVFDDTYPQGKKKFDGFIGSYRPVYDDAQERIEVQLLSYGMEMEHSYLELGTDAPYLVQSDDSVLGFTVVPLPTSNGTCQSFKAPSSKTLSRVTIRGKFDPLGTGATSATVRIRVINGTPLAPGSEIGAVAVQVGTPSEPEYYSTNMALPIVAGQQYHIAIDMAAPAGSLFYLSGSTSDPFPDGQVYRWNTGTGTWDSWSDSDIWFTLDQSSGGTTAALNNYYPGNMIKEAVNADLAKGNKVSFTTSTIDTAGTTLTNYTFQLATTLDVIRKSLELAPAGWYWYVDQATNLVHFHARPTAAAHTLALGAQLELLDLQYTTTDIVNVLYVMGGEYMSGRSLFKKYTDAASVAAYGQRAATYSDPNLTSFAVADLIGPSIIERLKNPSYRAVIEVNAAQYDIESFVVGQLIRLRGSPAMDALPLLPIARIEYDPDNGRLHLDTLPPDPLKRVESVTQDVRALQAAKNPGAPV